MRLRGADRELASGVSGALGMPEAAGLSVVSSDLGTLDSPSALGASGKFGASSESSISGKLGISSKPGASDLSGPLSVSIVVPLYNERRVIKQLLAELRPLRDACEIIFVDGGSTDGTVEAIGDEFRVIKSRRGRGIQLNTGAAATCGKVLFFLHADSSLPPDPLSEIRHALRHHRFGCFGLRFSPSSPLMRICQALSNYRCYVRRIVFGDQGLFIERSLFDELGGFSELPLMEDYELSLALRRKGLRPGVTRRRITTSSRRYGTTTATRLRTMWLMLRLRRMYRKGVSVEEIARRYGEAR